MEAEALGGFASGTNILVVAFSGIALDISHNIMSSNVAGTVALDINSNASGCTLGPNITVGPGQIPQYRVFSQHRVPYLHAGNCSVLT